MIDYLIVDYSLRNWYMSYYVCLRWLLHLLAIHWLGSSAHLQVFLDKQIQWIKREIEIAEEIQNDDDKIIVCLSATLQIAYFDQPINDQNLFQLTNQTPSKGHFQHT